MRGKRKSFEPIVAKPSEEWRNLVYRADSKSGRQHTAIVVAERTWAKCETAASSILNSKPGADNYSGISPRDLMSKAGGISPSTFYGHRAGGAVRGILSVDRAVASITARALAEDIFHLSKAIESGHTEGMADYFLADYLQEVLHFSSAHPEDAHGFLRAMFEGVLGRECHALVKSKPIHPATVVISPVSQLLSASGASSLYPDAEHVVRLVMGTGIEAGFNGEKASIEDVEGLNRFIKVN